MRKTLIWMIVTGLLLPGVEAMAQTDNEFWFVAPEISSSHEDRPINFTFISTDLPAHIKVEMPANAFSATNPAGFKPYEFDLAAFSVFKLDVTAQINVIEDQFTTRDGIAGKNIKAIHITSNNLINCYYEEGQTFNPDIFALLGRNALGTEFYCSFQDRAMNMSTAGWTFPAYSAFEVAFTEDNTFLTIKIPAGKAIYNGAGAPLTGTVTLGPFNRGESYQGAPAWVVNTKQGKFANDRFGRSAPDHLGGTRLTTNGKKIAVTLKDDSMKALVGGCYNLGGDQTIPVRLTGTEYIVMKGQLTTGALNSTYYNPPPASPVTQEMIYVTATDNNTSVFIDGVFKAVLNAGQSYAHEIVNPITRVTAADSGVYVWQITGTGCEYGGAILPTVSVCTGSFQVGFTRGTNDPFYINVMVRKIAKSRFKVYHNGVFNAAYTGLLNAGVFTDIPGSQWSAARINASIIPVNDVPAGVANTIMVTNDSDVFHLGIINGGASNGTRYGYFSDYNALTVNAFISESGSSDIRLCYGNSAQIVASGGKFYGWSPKDYLSDPYSSHPIASPPTNQAYRAYVRGACEMKDSTVISIQVSPPLEASYNIDTTFGCAPFKVKVRNQSFGIKKTWWDFGDGQKLSFNYPADRRVDTTFFHTYSLSANPAVTRTLRMIVQNSNQCRDTMDRPVVIYPEVTATMTADPDTGCHPLPVAYTNASANADYYQWEFGDGASSSETLPVHIFQNFNNAQRSYANRLIARSKYYCADTITKNVLVYPYLKASFSVDRTEGCAPFFIRASNSSLGGAGIKSYTWDFGDGSPLLVTSSASSPTYTYQNKTNLLKLFKLMLVVKNGNDCTDTLIREIRVHPDLNAFFTRMDTVGCHPLNVQFTAPVNLVPVTYTWDFGDGTSSSLPNPSHLYSNNSSRGFDTTFTARLIVTSTALCSDTVTRPVVVRPNIDAAFSVSTGQGCAPLAVSITNTSFGRYPGISNYSWSFGDGDTTTLASAQYKHTYQNNTSTEKTYNLRLVVRNSGQCRDTLIQAIRVFPKITTNFTQDKTAGCNPLQVTFTNTSNFPVPVNFNWDFGDGTSSVRSDTVHTFYNSLSKDTTVRVRLISSSAYMCADTQDVNITVYSFIDAAFTLAEASSCSPFAVTPVNFSRGGISQYAWNFGDGFTSSSLTPNHTYSNKTLGDQERDMRLIVRNNRACTDTLIRKITVYPEVRASFNPDRTEDCQPFTVSFTNTSNEPVANTYKWTFGEKGTSGDISAVVPFTFTNLGISDSTHAVRLYAESVHGCFDDTVINVKAFAYIKSDFKVENPRICSNYDIRFQNNSIGGIDGYAWDFDEDGIIDSGNGAPSLSQNYVNITPDPKVYNVMLRVKNTHECYDSLRQAVTIYPKITASFTSDTAGCHPFDVQFTNTTLNGNAFLGAGGDYDWYFGDGGTSGEVNPQKQFVNYTPDDEQKIVRMIAVSPYQCKDSSQQTIHVWHKPKARFSADKTIDCPPFNITLTNNSITSNANFIWNLGDGNFVNTASKDLLPHTYLNESAGIRYYTIGLANTTDHGCQDSTAMTVSVYPRVIAAFEYDSAGCSPFVSPFQNRSVNAVDYHWDFNDGKISILTDPSNRFVNLGAADEHFQVRLVSTSQYDCQDTAYHQVTVFGQPYAEFTPAPPYQVFKPLPVVNIQNFSNNQPDWNYAWDFGDQTGSNTRDAIFDKTYALWGPNGNGNQYTITLRAVNSLHSQCADTVIRAIKIVPPVPEIAINNTDPNGCEPFEVKFSVTFAYAYADSFYWEFDDGTFSREKEPLHTFGRYGIYNVKLTVTGDGGKNYAYKTVRVHQTPIADFDIAPRTAYLPDQRVKGFNKSQLAETYYWDFGDGFRTAEKDPEHLYDKLGKYPVKLVVYSQFGCVDSLIKPQIVSIEGTGMIEFPNAFTPDMAGEPDGHYANLTGESINDIFYPKHEGIKEYHLEIYTRWGEKLFETDDVWEGWNGYYKEKLCKQDVYVWKAKGVFWNGLEFLKAGDVTLLQKKD